MSLCVQISEIFSTCAKRKYAALLLDEYGHVVGMGYNGGPKGIQHCDDGGCPRLKDNSPNGTSYDNCIAIHAEANALLHSDYSSRPKTLYVNGPPCFSCAKLIANSTIEKVVCKRDLNYLDWNNVKAFLQMSDVTVLELEDGSF